MKPLPKWGVILLTVTSSAIYIALTVLAWDGWSAFMGHPARAGAVVAIVVISVAAMFTSGSKSSGRRDDTRNRSILLMWVTGPGGCGRRPDGDAPRSGANALGARWLVPARPQPPIYCRPPSDDSEPRAVFKSTAHPFAIGRGSKPAFSGPRAHLFAPDGKARGKTRPKSSKS